MSYMKRYLDDEVERIAKNVGINSEYVFDIVMSDIVNSSVINKYKDEKEYFEDLQQELKEYKEACGGDIEALEKLLKAMAHSDECALIFEVV